MDRLTAGPAGQPMNMACRLLVAAFAFKAWYHNENIVVAHLHLLIGLSSTIYHQCTPAFASFILQSPTETSLGSQSILGRSAAESFRS